MTEKRAERPCSGTCPRAVGRGPAGTCTEPCAERPCEHPQAASRIAILGARCAALSDQPFHTVLARLEQAIAQVGLAIRERRDLRATLAPHGYLLDGPCMVLDVPWTSRMPQPASADTTTCAPRVAHVSVSDAGESTLLCFARPTHQDDGEPRSFLDRQSARYTEALLICALAACL